MKRVVLYSRPGCHLCDEARDVILAEHERTSFDFHEVDIERDDALVRDFGVRIPVVEIDGEERFEITLDPVAFAAEVALRPPDAGLRSKVSRWTWRRRSTHRRSQAR